MRDRDRANPRALLARFRSAGIVKVRLTSYLGCEALAAERFPMLAGPHPARYSAAADVLPLGRGR
jgi:hypothetical protein